MSNDAPRHSDEPTGDRVEQRGPEMDDDQVAATNEFTDSLPAAGEDEDLED
jgi:hypothetical protein